MLEEDRKQPSKFDKGIVTFLDVLGWKGMWQNNIDAIEKLKLVVKETRDKAEKLVELYNQKGNATNVRYKDIDVKVVSISDTIVLLTKIGNNDSIRLHAQLCSWVLKTALSEGFPLRGAISYGEFTESENIMLGPAIDEAAAWHESTDWIGVILTPSAQMYLRNEKVKYIIDNYSEIPFKKHTNALHRCVDWSFSDEESLYDIFLEKGPHMPEVAPKYLNTIKFLEWKKSSSR